MLYDYTGLLYELSLILVHDLMLVLKLLCEQHSFLSDKLHTSLLHLLIFILSGRNGKSLCKSCKFVGHLTYTSIIYPLSLSSSEFFYKVFIKF